MTPRLHIAGEKQPAKQPLTMAHLDQFSRAAELAIDLPDAVAELRDALLARDPETAMRACRRMLGFGCLFGDVANELERLSR